MLAHLPPGSPVPAYLRRLLLADADAGRLVFRRLFEASQGLLAALTERGMAAPGADPPVRAALLMANDLAVLLLRDQLTDVLGVDPLSRDGIRRWTAEMLAIYGGGLREPAPSPSEHQMPEVLPGPEPKSGGGR
jgi:TetR/AcrR family transcriptional regulator, regulator of cefoperazone and chloramphenicol sensitivity